jgi:hypothetical protein
VADEIADDFDHPQRCDYSWVAFLNMNSALLSSAREDTVEEHDASGSFHPRSVVTGGGHGRRAEDELLRFSGTGGWKDSD